VIEAVSNNGVPWPASVLETNRDITERRAEESRTGLLAVIVRSSGPATGRRPAECYFQSGWRILSGPALLFNEIDLENDTEIVHSDYCRGVESVVGKHKISEYSSITSAEMREGKTVVNSDSKTDHEPRNIIRNIRTAGNVHM